MCRAPPGPTPGGAAFRGHVDELWTAAPHLVAVLIAEMLMSCCWYFDIGNSKVERAPQGNGCPSTFVQHAPDC